MQTLLDQPVPDPVAWRQFSHDLAGHLTDEASDPVQEDPLVLLAGRGVMRKVQRNVEGQHLAVVRLLEELVLGEQRLGLIDGIHPVDQIQRLAAALGDGGIGVDPAAPVIDRGAQDID